MIAVVMTSACDACGSASVEAGQSLCEKCRKPARLRAALEALQASLVTFYTNYQATLASEAPIGELVGRLDVSIDLAKRILSEASRAVDLGASDRDLDNVHTLAKIAGRSAAMSTGKQS